MTEHVDVLIVGAGLSGIGAACQLRRRFPAKTFTILEARGTIGGTWDLFRYPGVRSDSDMHTLGYRFRPWTDRKAIADGPAILRYVRDTAREYGVDRAIRYGHRAVRAEWSSTDARWTVTAHATGNGNVDVDVDVDVDVVEFSCGFLLSCSGYYRYDQGYTPEFAGSDRFPGPVVHPQHWPGDLDYAGKRVVVIGSGATAVTLVPAMAPAAAHVTMLQRSPTYITTLPSEDGIARRLRQWLPGPLAHGITRWKNVLLQTGTYQLSRRRPQLVREMLRKAQQRQLPPGYDIDTHFNPRYNPWDQRLCVVPDGDLFRSIRDGAVSIVTDQVDTFTENGIKLASGGELPADIIVTATGLNLLIFGGMELAVDGHDIHLPDTMAYKGLMLSGVPNFAYTVGYTNASWTLKADLVSGYVCRLLSHMDEHGYRQAVPERDPAVAEEPFMDFAAGYVLRSLHLFPKQGSRAPWRLRQNYLRDMLTLRHGPIGDAMRFATRARTPVPATGR